MSIEFATTKDSLKVEICEYELFFEFNELAIIHCGIFIFQAIARKPSENSLYFYSSDDGVFLLREDGESIKIDEIFEFDDGALVVKAGYFWNFKNQTKE
jgi:hypothetical protein